MQANDFAKEFDDYGKEKIEFAELAKIWEDNKYEDQLSDQDKDVFRLIWTSLLYTLMLIFLTATPSAVVRGCVYRRQSRIDAAAPTLTLRRPRT